MSWQGGRLVWPFTSDTLVSLLLPRLVEAGAVEWL